MFGLARKEDLEALERRIADLEALIRPLIHFATVSADQGLQTSAVLGNLTRRLDEMTVPAPGIDQPFPYHG